MATSRVLRFDTEGRPLEFSVWLLRARRLLERQIQAHETLWVHASSNLPEPADPTTLAADPTPADSDRYAREHADVTAWKSRDAAACIALSSLLPESEETHFTHVRTASEFLTAIKACYATPTTVSLGCLFLPFLFPDLASFERTADLITHLHSLGSSYRAACTDTQLALLPPPMAITIYFIATSLPDRLASVRDALLLKHPSELTIEVLESALKDVESNLRSVASASGVVPPPLFHGCTVPQLPTFTASLTTAATDVTAAAVNVNGSGVLAQPSLGQCQRLGRMCGSISRPFTVGELLEKLRRAAGDRFSVAVDQGARQLQLTGLGDGWAIDQEGQFDQEARQLQLTGLGDGWAVDQEEQSVDLTSEQRSTRESSATTADRFGQRKGSINQGVARRELWSTRGTWWSTRGTRWSTRGTWWSTRAPGVVQVDQTYGPALWGMSASQLVDLLGTPHAMYVIVDSSASDSVYSSVVSLGTSLAEVPVASVGTCVDTSLGAAPEDALLSFTLDSRASPWFFRDRTTLTPLPTPVPASHQVVVSPQVAVSGPVAVSCSCWSLAHPTVLWHHQMGHPSISRLRAMSSQRLVLGLPRVLPSLPPSLAPPCGPCVEGWLSATPHSSSLRPATEPFETLHLDVWGPASCPGPDRESFFLVVVGYYSRYITEFPLAKKSDVTSTLIRWLLTTAYTRGHPVSCLHSDCGGEFHAGILAGFCREQGIRHFWTLPESPQQNGVAERCIGLVMEIAHTSMTHARAPYFLWPYAVRYAAHQLNLWPCVSRPEVSPTGLWTGSPGAASRFRVWGCLALVCDTSADKISPRAVPCVFLGFSEDSSDYTFYCPPLHRFFDSRDVCFDESVPYYVRYPCRGLSVPPPPLFLTSAPPPAPPVQPPPPGPASSGVSHATPPPSVAPQVQPPSPQSSSQPTADPARASFLGKDPGGASSRSAGVGAKSVPVRGDSSLRGVGDSGAVPGGATPGGAPSAGPGEPRTDPVTSGGAGSGGGATSSLESAAGWLEEQQQQQQPEQDQPQQQQPPPPPVSSLRTLGLPSPSPPSPPSPTVSGPPLPPPDPSPAVFPPPLPTLSPPLSFTWPSRRSPRARPSSPVPFTNLYTAMFCSSLPRSSPSVLPSPPKSALTASLSTAVTDYYHMYHPVLSHVLASLVTDPRASLSSVSALTAAFTEFASTRCLDYATSLVAAPPTSPLAVGGGSALGCDALEDRQFELEFLAVASPHLCAMLLAPEGDPDALVIPTPRIYAEAVSWPWASQWRAAMDSEMVSYRSTGTYVDEVPPPVATVVDGMWIFRVKRPPGSPPVFKARYVARGFSQREGVDFFQTFAPTPKMTTLWMLLHVAAQRDYELHSLDFSTAFLQGSLHEEVWSFSGSSFSNLLYSAQPLTVDHTLTRPFPDEPFEPRGPFAELMDCLMHLMICTRPDLAFPLSILARFVAPGRHRPVHWTAAVRVVKYLATTSGVGLVLGGRQDVVLTGHCDSSYADDAETHRSTHSSSVSSSTAEAEIYAGAMAAQELRWLTFLLTNLSERPSSAPTLFTDNKATILLCREPRLESRVKHINISSRLAGENANVAGCIDRVQCYLLEKNGGSGTSGTFKTQYAGDATTQVANSVSYPLSFVGGLCNGTALVENDPHLTGAHGTHYDFTGRLDKSFCLFSDRRFHVNMHLNGYQGAPPAVSASAKSSESSTELHTWIKELGVVWMTPDGANHTLRMVARKGKRQDRGENGFLRVAGLGELDVRVRVAHPLLQTPTEAEVHFNVELSDVAMTSAVHGVLGQTFKNSPEQLQCAVKYSHLAALLHRPVDVDKAEGKGFLDGDVEDHISSSVVAPDCKYASYGSA
ncbi:unnamed protein product [Closterium sp. NIES-54]